MDRYYSALDATGRRAPCGSLMAAISVLMAAKLEQSISPNFNRMISLMPEAHRSLVKKKSLIDLEFDIIQTLQWDLQWASPNLFVERYLKVMDLSSEPSLLYLSKQFCKFAAHKPQLTMGYKQSVIAAAALTLALNVSTSGKLSKSINCDYLSHLVNPMSEDCLGWWISEVVKQTEVNLHTVQECYRLMLTMLNDSEILKNKLQEDQAIWPTTPEVMKKRLL